MVVVNVEMCAKRHQNILASVWNALKTSGIVRHTLYIITEKKMKRMLRWIIENLEPNI